MELKFKSTQSIWTYLTPSAATTSSTSTTVFSGWLNESFRLAVPQTAKTLRP